MLAIRRNTEKDFRITLKTEREEDNHEVQIVCNTILELIELEKEIKPILNATDDIFVEILYKNVNKLIIDYKEYESVSLGIRKQRLATLRKTKKEEKVA